MTRRVEMVSCCFCVILVGDIPSVVRKTKLKYSLSFPYIFHRAVGLLAFHQIYTVRNFTVEILVDLPFTLVYS